MICPLIIYIWEFPRLVVSHGYSYITTACVRVCQVLWPLCHQEILD